MLEGKLIRLRALEYGDLSTLRDWRNNKNLRVMTREYRLINMLKQKNWFEMISKENPPSAIMFGVINNRNKLIGVCGLTYIDWKNKHAEISCYLTKDDWQQMIDCLGGDEVAGGKLKSLELWNSPNTGATNESGFNGLPGGFRLIDGIFEDIAVFGKWWSCTENSTIDAWYQYMNYNNTNIENDFEIGRAHV